ncbi:MAG: twin-arginine translocation signal domain-containing protein [Proteobacteria bacterium]|nr:twin-arginine translocation signal domain-containing protein [Pseudomonadota bacterium]MDA1354849.1 twin-arginine translocation signal domain-containing protein [Pseudomonadota bacterium]
MSNNPLDILASRRSFLLGSGAALGAMALTTLGSSKFALADTIENAVLQTVTGPVSAADI